MDKANRSINQDTKKKKKKIRIKHSISRFIVNEFSRLLLAGLLVLLLSLFEGFLEEVGVCVDRD